MNLIAANHIAYRLLAKHLPGAGWSLGWNTRASAAGVCKYRTRTIEFSSLITKHVEEAEFTDTVLHEIAHAMVGPGHNHDAVWKTQFLAIGGSGSRTWSDPDVAAKTAKWEITCRACTFKTHRNRLTTHIKNNSRCPKCKTPQLNFKQNR